MTVLVYLYHYLSVKLAGPRLDVVRTLSLKTSTFNDTIWVTYLLTSFRADKYGKRDQGLDISKSLGLRVTVHFSSSDLLLNTVTNREDIAFESVCLLNYNKAVGIDKKQLKDGRDWVL
jgi:hypothetical protein